MEGPEEEPCAICMEPLESKPHACMPGCRHRFHVTCMLNCAMHCTQHDLRCPICRSAAEGVAPRATEPATEPAVSIATMVLDMEEMEESMRRAHEADRREWRRYADRRRRLLRQRPHLSERVDRLRDIRTTMCREYEDASRIYERKCREVWRADPEVKRHRDALGRLRRRERRIQRSLETDLGTILGPEPG